MLRGARLAINCGNCDKSGKEQTSVINAEVVLPAFVYKPPLRMLQFIGLPPILF
jgi:hypothetical protein